MKKLLIMLCSLAILFTLSLSSYAYDLNGNVSILYGTGTIKPNTVMVTDTYVNTTETSCPGFQGELELTKKLSLTASYFYNKSGTKDGQDFKDAIIPVTNVGAAYNILDNRDLKVNALIGYVSMKTYHADSNPNNAYDHQYYGFGYGVQGIYKTKYKANISYKVNYFPTITNKRNDSFIKADIYQHQLEVDYPVNNRYGLKAGFQSSLITGKCRVGGAPADTDLYAGSFYIGATVKF